MIDVVLGHVFSESLKTSDSCRAVFAAVEAINSRLLPIRYGNVEPLRKQFSFDAIASDWNDAVIWKGRSPASDGNYWPNDRFSPHDIVYLDVAEAGFGNDLVSLQARWAERFMTYFGYVHVVSDTHVALPEYESRIMPLGRGLTWRDIEKCLPCVAWSMWFGPEYVKKVGRDKLLSAPAYRVSESDAGICLQLTESAQLLIDDYPTYRQLRDALVRHLGPDVVAPIIVEPE